MTDNDGERRRGRGRGPERLKTLSEKTEAYDGDASTVQVMRHAILAYAYRLQVSDCLLLGIVTELQVQIVAAMLKKGPDRDRMIELLCETIRSQCAAAEDSKNGRFQDYEAQ